MAFKIVRNDIVKMNTEAIVNTANDHVAVGEGCDTAVYTAAGYDELLNYRKEHIGFVEEGGVFITPGFKLPAKYIIHAVSPFYRDGNRGEEEKLRSCYRKSLALAKEHGIKSIAFPLISTGSFGYPKEEGMRIAADEIHAFLTENEMEIYLVVFDTKATELGERLYPGLEAYIDHHYVLDKREEEYGDRYFGSYHPEDEEFEGYAKKRDALESRLSGRKGRGAAGMPVPKSAMDMPRVSAAHGTREGMSTAHITMDEVPVVRSMRAVPMPSVRASEEREETECGDEAELDFDELQKKLDERMKHMADTFSQYLLYLIEKKGMDNVEVYKRAIVDKKIFSKIKNNINYHPQKLTALCLCIGARLSMDETRDLLARAGFALSPCDKTDIIFSYFIEEKIYDMIELDIQLEEHGLPCIIT